MRYFILAKMDLLPTGSFQVKWSKVKYYLILGMGGAMDLVSSGSRIVVTMEHTSKNGSPKILKKCTLPLTGHQCVDRIITELCVMDVVDGKLVLVEIAESTTVEDLRKVTDADFLVSTKLITMH